MTEKEVSLIKTKKTINVIDLEKLIKKNIADFFSQPNQSWNRTKAKTMWKTVLTLTQNQSKNWIEKATVLSALNWYNINPFDESRKKYMDLLKNQIINY